MFRDLSFGKLTPQGIRNGCLAMIGLITMLVMAVGSQMSLAFCQKIITLVSIAGALLLGSSLREPLSRQAKRMLLLGMGFCLWTGLLQIYDLRYFGLQKYYDPRFSSNAFFLEYMVLLPFAFLADEKQRDTGMKILGGFFLGGSMILSFFAVMLNYGWVPVSMQEILNWEGPRLGVVWHPNITAAILMVGMSLSIAFLTRSKKLWQRILLGLVAAAELVFLILTHCRTVTVMACCILGGLVFFLIWRKGSWKRILVVALVIALLLAAAGIFYSAHSNRYAEANDLSKEDAAWEGGQGSLASNLGNLNGRTSIWGGIFRAILDHPQVLLVGSWEIGDLISPYIPFYTYHGHNAWIQCLLGTGLIGLVFALAITYLAVKNILLLFFFRKSTMFQKTIGLMVIALMGAEFFEPYLFYADFPRNFLNMIFLFSVGYLVYWASNAEKLD